jgi:chromatin modification-related protein VID21
MRNGVNGLSTMNQQSYANNAQALMASYAANMNGNGTPGSNGMHMASMAAGSPGARYPQQLSQNLVAQVSQLEAQFRAKNPNLTPEQARHLSMEHLTRAMMAQRQSAMNAAAGANGQSGLANGMGATTGPHQYAALLRQQQAQQQAQQAQQQQQQYHHQGQQQQSAHAQLARAQQTPLMQAQQAQQAAASASPAQSHQRLSSGSATPSASASK